jgi:hypothetical protein
MIYQLYYKNDYGLTNFNDNYSKLDLSTITDDQYLPSIQSEYCGMLYVWLNNLDIDNWTGFTSCKQFKKHFTTIVTYNRTEICDLLVENDIITWGFLCRLDKRFCHYNKINNLFDQSEYFHPGLMNLIDSILKIFSYNGFIDIFKINQCGIYANYWLMSRNNFHSFMVWSLPLVQYMVNNPSLCNTKIGHYNTIGFAIERMFIYWYLSNNKTIKILNYPLC